VTPTTRTPWIRQSCTIVLSRDETAVRRRLVARRHNRNETAPHGSLVATLCTLWPCDLDLWPFDLIFVDGRDIMMDYHCVKFEVWSLYFQPFSFYRLKYVFHFLTLLPWPLIFRPINIIWWVRYRDGPSLAILVSAVLVLTCGQNHRLNRRGGWSLYRP